MKLTTPDWIKALYDNHIAVEHLPMLQRSFYGLGKQQTGVITCNSGLILSIQAGRGYYSYPRGDRIGNKIVSLHTHEDTNNHYEGYESFEVCGIGEEELTLLSQYLASDGEGIIYQRVPHEVITKLIADNGGIKHNLEDFCE